MFRNWKSISGVGFVFVLTFFVASVVQADYVYMGTLKQGCADTGCQKTSVSSSSGKNRTSEAYMNLAQAIRSANVQSQKSRPQSSISLSTNTSTPQKAISTPQKTVLTPQKAIPPPQKAKTVVPSPGTLISNW